MNKKFEDIIAEQGKLVYTNEGDSMFPIIRARDLLIIEAVREPLKVGDVPLYKRFLYRKALLAVSICYFMNAFYKV